MLPLEFVVLGTPISFQGSSAAKRFWQQRVREAAQDTPNRPVASAVDVVLRIAYFYEYAPAADLDNIVKPIQDALKGISFDDDIRVVDLIASMRRKAVSDRIPSATTALARGLASASDFVHIVVDHSSRIEALR